MRVLLFVLVVVLSVSAVLMVNGDRSTERLLRRKVNSGALEAQPGGATPIPSASAGMPYPPNASAGMSYPPNAGSSALSQKFTGRGSSFTVYQKNPQKCSPSQEVTIPNPKAKPNTADVKVLPVTLSLGAGKKTGTLKLTSTKYRCYKFTCNLLKKTAVLQAFDNDCKGTPSATGTATNVAGPMGTSEAYGQCIEILNTKKQVVQYASVACNY